MNRSAIDLTGQPMGGYFVLARAMNGRSIGVTLITPQVGTFCADRRDERLVGHCCGDLRKSLDLPRRGIDLLSRLLRLNFQHRQLRGPNSVSLSFDYLDVEAGGHVTHQNRHATPKARILDRTDIRVKSKSANSLSCGLDPAPSQGYAGLHRWLVNDDEFSRVDRTRRFHKFTLRSYQLRTEQHGHGNGRVVRNHAQLRKNDRLSGSGFVSKLGRLRLDAAQRRASVPHGALGSDNIHDQREIDASTWLRVQAEQHVLQDRHRLAESLSRATEPKIDQFPIFGISVILPILARKKRLRHEQPLTLRSHEQSDADVSSLRREGAL